ncbi:brain-specific angiogenesis inhibitor 1-associated protein 2 isoform X5 [Corvus kubaryi]|uniref:brain-specific angiogenesis inhibitor 1-associated protein 2 isoform X5 n=1 Tax=Corvus moneduloides TaxID=1196302 RepID=UPI001362ECD6|nr:brain-specific angiogenesis inhibitor 1-associated protein 2 isoform X5 [Corvus moneduloides]XP_041881491.1 brain-specific angiogenesis inhibitor 1-associated protein 2 isoform X5 [Corvus kubaryi]
MVLPGPPGMARSEEVHRLTENVYKTIMEQFNPSLRNFISMGKTYEKALASMTYAAKGYFDALVKMGELASESQGSKELGDVLFQMAEVHRQIQNQLEEMLKSFHNELLTQLEQKVELDSRYLSAALKKYQTEQRSKGDSLDKCQAELKKLRKKSQGSKNPQKYSDKELQYIEAISNKQGELENYVSDGYKTALTEERRRFCFLVEKQCAVAKSAITYHAKGKEMLTQKLPLWQQSCSDPNKIPDRAIQLMQQMAASSNGTIMPSPLSTSKSNLIISDPIPGAKPLPVPPELAPFVGPQKQLSDSYSNTLPVRKNVPAKNSYASAENKTLPRSSSMAAGLERNGRTRVQAIFSHAAGDNSTLLSFKEGDLITLLVPEARDGWHYGESEKTKMRGWFPFSYTRVLDNDGSERVHTSLQQGKSSSTGNLLDKDDISIPPPDYGMASQAFPAQGGNTFKQRPYSVAVPAFSQDYLMPYGCAIKDYSSGLCQAPSAHYKPYTRSTAGLDDYGTRSVSRNPFANVQLKPTVTNDRSAPLIS